MGIRTRITQKKQYRGFEADFQKKVTDLIKTSAEAVRATAVSSIATGNKSGRVRPDGSRASAAGEPPATDTGILASNIFVSVDADGLGASVESRANYSVFLEFGTSNMAARPFMQPALEQNKPKIRRLEKRIFK